MIPRNSINSRLPVLFVIAVILIVLTACGSGGGGSRAEPQPQPPVQDSCDSTSELVNGSCQAFATRSDERIPTAFTEDGAAVSLEAVIFRPLTGARFPTLIFNHGSTGNGSDPALFTQTFTHKPVTKFFVERGWQVVYPQRRGRGESDGLYNEGFAADRSGYSCEASLSLPGADRALDDLDVITDWVRGRADVDTTRLAIGGTSRGGILSVAFTARRPDVFIGALNFVGGWIAEGCGEHLLINTTLFNQGASSSVPSLWLYAANDSFYSLAYSRGLYDAYEQAGGVAAFETFTRSAGLNGHFLINDPSLWGPVVEENLALVL